MKKIIIGAIVIIILIAGIILSGRLLKPKQETVEVLPTPTTALPTITDDIKVDLTFRQNNQIATLKIRGLTPDMESVEYELTYLTGAGLPRGVLGKISLKGEKEVMRDDIVLGTCSSGKCVYDTGVSNVDLALKFNTASESKVFQKTYNL